MNVES
jgi:hypothetical protein